MLLDEVFVKPLASADNPYQDLDILEIEPTF